MSWVAVGIGVAGLAVDLYSSNKQSKAAKGAANAQQAAQQAAIDEQRREYDQTRSDQLPFLQAGYGALDKEKALLNGDYSGFENSPDYQFALNQGIGALDKSAASRGSLYSGGHSQDLNNYAQGTASQFLNSYWNKLAGQAGQGQVTAGNLGSLGASMAGNIGNYMNNIGNARASSYLQQGAIDSEKAGALGNTFNQFLGYYSNRAPASSGAAPYSGFDVGGYDQFTNPDVSSFYGDSPGTSYDMFSSGGYA